MGCRNLISLNNTIDQTSAKCTIKDSSGTTIFPGTTLDNAVYVLTAEVDPDHNIFKTLRPEFTGQYIMYDGENDIWTYKQV